MRYYFYRKSPQEGTGLIAKLDTTDERRFDSAYEVFIKAEINEGLVILKMRRKYT